MQCNGLGSARSLRARHLTIESIRRRRAEPVGSWSLPHFSVLTCGSGTTGPIMFHEVCSILDAGARTPPQG